MISFNFEFLADSTLYSSIFKNSRLTNVKFINANFESSLFESCCLDNCVFENTNLNSTEFNDCSLKNCLLINCHLSDSSFTETIFEECRFQADKKGSLDQACFESCHFIKTIFTGFTGGQIGSASLIDSKFSNRNNSIEFKGSFYLISILQPKNGISGMLNSI